MNIGILHAHFMDTGSGVRAGIFQSFLTDRNGDSLGPLLPNANDLPETIKKKLKE